MYCFPLNECLSHCFQGLRKAHRSPSLELLSTTLEIKRVFCGCGKEGRVHSQVFIMYSLNFI